jgi:Mg-chelatase subunit ChlD
MGIGRLLLLLILALSASGAAAQTTEPALPSGFQDRSKVRRIQWPVRFVEREPGGCDAISASDIELREDGVVVPVDAVERRRLPTIHAVVLDNSASMQGRIGTAREAALGYLQRLPEGEPAMLATFSDNLVLRTPLTTDREKFSRAVEGIEPRASTALNDAFHYSVKYLSSRPERKILIWITDGCDSVSLPKHSFASIMREAAEVPNLTVYPIGIDLPARCGGLLMTPGYLDGPVYPLQRLASSSGGELFRTKGGAALEMVFDAILKRVESEGFVSFRPLSFGDGPKDIEGKERKRRIRVRSKRERSCRVQSAGPLVRIERPPSTVAPQITEDLTVRRYDGRISLTRLELDRERSLLYSPTSYHLKNDYISVLDRKERFIEREVTVEVPPFEWVQQRLTSPEALLYYLLQNEEVPFLPIDVAETRRERAQRRFGEKWTHGQTWIEMREPLARALFEYDGYREFAYARTQEDYRREMKQVLATSAEVQRLSEDDRERLRLLIEQQSPEPPPERLQNYLAEWLGDIPAYELVVGFEGWISNAVLSSPTEHSRSKALLDLVDRRWSQLDDWFPPPTQVRVIAPLVPTYDAEQNRIGFWRIVLPDVMGVGPPTNAVPPHPLGLTFIRHLMTASSDPSLLHQSQLQRLSYRFDDRRTRRRMMRGARKRGLIPKDLYWKRVPMVQLDLGVESDQAPLAVTVLWEPETRQAELPPEPICVHFSIDPSVTLSTTAAALQRQILELAPNCEPPTPI